MIPENGKLSFEASPIHGFGAFARTRLNAMTEADLNAFEALIELPDQQMLSWITGEADVPAGLSNPLLPELLKYRP